MIIIKDNRVNLNPLIDVSDHEALVPQLLELIEEYMLANKVRTIFEDTDQEVFFISGLAEAHHRDLADYFNNFAFENEDFNAELISGNLGEFPATHHWIDIDGLIVDIAFSELKNESENLPEYFNNFRECNCFTCDNPKNVLYGLYKEGE